MADDEDTPAIDDKTRWINELEDRLRAIEAIRAYAQKMHDELLEMYHGSVPVPAEVKPSGMREASNKLLQRLKGPPEF